MLDASVHLFFPSSTVSDPFPSLFASVEDPASVSVLTRALCVLQVLKPLSEHYMEDNVRQTVVNSIKASLTEQAAQSSKLKTHWSSSSSPSSTVFVTSCSLAQHQSRNCGPCENTKAEPSSPKTPIAAPPSCAPCGLPVLTLGGPSWLPDTFAGSALHLLQDWAVIQGNWHLHAELLSTMDAN